MLTRREFLAQSGYVTLILTPLAAACGSSDNNASAASCNGVSSTSTVVGGHSHTLCVPNTDLTSPAAGGATYTSSSTGHTHTVMLSAAQLTSIAQGQSVTVTSSVDSGHSHDFAIAKATASHAPTERRSHVTLTTRPT
jgi:hypothetical protein